MTFLKGKSTANGGRRSLARAAAITAEPLPATTETPEPDASNAARQPLVREPGRALLTRVPPTGGSSLSSAHHGPPPCLAGARRSRATVPRSWRQQTREGGAGEQLGADGPAGPATRTALMRNALLVDDGPGPEGRRVLLCSTR